MKHDFRAQCCRIAIAVLLLSLLSLSYGFSQTAALSGQIVLKSKQDGRIVPLKGVQISARGANQQYSKDDGRFILYFSDAKPGDPIRLTLELAGYEVYQGNDNLHFETFLPRAGAEISIAMIRSGEIKAEIDRIATQLNKKIADKENRITQLELENQTLKGPERLRMQAAIDSLKGVLDRYRDNRGVIAQAIVYGDLEDAPDFVKEANRVFRATGNLDAALQILDTSDVKIRMLRDEGERKLKQAKIAYLTRAKFELANFDFKSAYRYYLKALEIDSTDVGVLLEVADFREQATDLERAVHFNLKALQQVRFEEDSALILGYIGRCYLKLDNTAEAERYLNRSLSIYYNTPERYRTELRPAFVFVANQLGIVYERYNEYYRADSLYRRALPVAEALAKENHEKYAGYLGDLYRSAGLMRVLFGEKDKALQLHQKSQAIFTKLVNEGQTRYMTKLPWGYSIIGLRYYAAGKDDSAKLAYQAALDYARSLYAKNPETYVFPLIDELISHANYCQVERMHSKAQKYYREADSLLQGLSERQKDMYKSTYAGILSRLAEYLDTNTEYEKREKLEKTAEGIYRQLNRQSPKAYRTQLAGVSRTLAINAMNNREYAAAEVHILEELRIWQTLEQSNPTFYRAEMARSYSGLSLILLAKPDMERSLVNANKGIAIMEDLAAEKPDQYAGELASALDMLGLYYTFNSEILKAYEVNKRQIKLLEPLHAKDSSYASSLADKLMSLHLHPDIPLNEQESNLKKAENILRALAKRDFAYYGAKLADCFTRFSNLYDVYDNAKERERYLKEALEMYEKLEQERPGVYFDKLADCYSMLAGIYKENKNIPAAKAYYQKAIDMVKASNAKDPVGFQLSGQLFYEEALADILQDAGEYAQAEKIFLSVHADRKRLLDQQGALHLNNYIHSCLNVGNLYYDMHKWPEAKHYLDEGFTLAKQQTDASPDDKDPGRHLGRAWNLSGNWHLAQSNYMMADSCFRAYTEIYKSLAQKDSVRYVNGLLIGMNNLAITRTQLGDLETALKLRQEVVAHGKKLYRQNPQKYAEDMALYYRNLANAFVKLQQFTPATRLIDTSLNLYRALYAQKAEAIADRFVATLLVTGNILQSLHDYDHAGALFREAMKLQKEMFQKNPGVEASNMANLHNFTGYYYKAIGKMPEAAYNFQESVKLYESLLKSNLKSAENDMTFPLIHEALLQAMQEEWKTGEENLKKATALRKKIATELPDAYQDDWANCQNSWGDFYRYKKEYKKALQYHEKALAILRIKAAGSNAAYAPAVARTLSAMGEACEKSGKYDLADAYLDEALKIQREITQSEPRAFQPDLAFTLHRYGVLLKKTGKTALALTSLQQAFQIRKRYAEETPDAFNFYLAQTALELIELPNPDVPDAARYYQNLAEYLMGVYPKTHPYYRIYAKQLREND